MIVVHRISVGSMEDFRVSKALHLIAKILEHRETVSSKSYVRDSWAKIPIMGHNSHLLIPKSDFFFFTIACGTWDFSCPARD